MFILTSAAAEQISRAADEQPDSPSLRVAAKFDTDGEVVYGMGFDDPRDDDLVIDSEGVRILIAKPSQALLAGATLDFVEVQPGEFQFVFSHASPPQAEGNGGCDSGAGPACGGCGSRGPGCA